MADAMIESGFRSTNRTADIVDRAGVHERRHTLAAPRIDAAETAQRVDTKPGSMDEKGNDEGRRL
jgi:hypothetical protein